jgi:hypothetical protein
MARWRLSIGVALLLLRPRIAGELFVASGDAHDGIGKNAADTRKCSRPGNSFVGRRRQGASFLGLELRMDRTYVRSSLTSLTNNPANKVKSSTRDDSICLLTHCCLIVARCAALFDRALRVLCELRSQAGVPPKNHRSLARNTPAQIRSEFPRPRFSFFKNYLRSENPRPLS